MDMAVNMMSEASVAATADVETVATTIGTGVAKAFEIAGSAFDFLMSNPLCALMVGIGFAYTALGLIRRGIRVAKRT